MARLMTRRERTSMTGIFRTAMLHSLLNPKALLFFMVFLPQFVAPAHGNVALQLTVLGCTLACAGLLFNSALAAFSGQVGAFLNRSPRAAKYQGWFLGGILVSLAARLLLLDRLPSR